MLYLFFFGSSLIIVSPNSKTPYSIPIKNSCPMYEAVTIL